MNHRKLIPGPVLAVCAEIAATRESHTKLDSKFIYAGATGDPPSGSRQSKAIEWLKRVNKDESLQPLDVLGRLVENYMDPSLRSTDVLYQRDFEHRERIRNILAEYGLQYVLGGKIISALGMPSRTLEVFIRSHNVVAIDDEFKRALQNVESEPREAVSAASNILESLCKVYIAENGLDLPSKQDLQPIWTVVRKHLGFDPGQLEDQDLQMILSGMISIVHGIGNLRTHASSAHGAGNKSYKLEPRHARMAIHAAHTIVLFVLETWQKKSK